MENTRLARLFHAARKTAWRSWYRTSRGLPPAQPRPYTSPSYAQANPNARFAAPFDSAMAGSPVARAHAGGGTARGRPAWLDACAGTHARRRAGTNRAFLLPRVPWPGPRADSGFGRRSARHRNTLGQRTTFDSVRRRTQSRRLPAARPTQESLEARSNAALRPVKSRRGPVTAFTEIHR